MIFGVVVDRLLLESPLTDAPQVYRYTLLIAKLGADAASLPRASLFSSNWSNRIPFVALNIAATFAQKPPSLPARCTAPTPRAAPDLCCIVPHFLLRSGQDSSVNLPILSIE